MPARPSTIASTPSSASARSISFSMIPRLRSPVLPPPASAPRRRTRARNAASPYLARLRSIGAIRGERLTGLPLSPCEPVGKERDRLGVDRRGVPVEDGGKLGSPSFQPAPRCQPCARGRRRSRRARRRNCGSRPRSHRRRAWSRTSVIAEGMSWVWPISPAQAPRNAWAPARRRGRPASARR